MGISYGVQVEKHNYSPFEPSLGPQLILWVLKSSAAPTLEEVSLPRPKMKAMETRRRVSTSLRRSCEVFSELLRLSLVVC